MTRHVLVIGGTRFIGRWTVDEFLDHGYDVTLFNRGNHDNPFADRDAVDHFRGDRTDDGDLVDAAALDPDVVVDVVAYHPQDVRTATEVFDDVDAYVYVSSGATYSVPHIPKREGETPIYECSDEQARDDSKDTYGPRKAEGDRAVFAAAERGVNAKSVRPTVVYGPYDYFRRLDYWIHRVANYERVLVPGDGSNIWHAVAVENVARAIRVVAEEGRPGEAYNAGDWSILTVQGIVETVAAELDTEVSVVTASERELAEGGLEPTDFPLYRNPPHLLDTHKLKSLGWDPVPPAEMVAESIAASPESDAEETENGPDREREEAVLDGLAPS